MAPPGFDEDLGFLEGVKDFSIQELVAQPRIEALDVAVLPRPTGLDQGGAGPDRGNPSPDGLGHELRTIVGPDVAWDTAQDEQVRQDIDNVGRGELPPNSDRQALTRELVQDVEGSKGVSPHSKCSRGSAPKPP